MSEPTWESFGMSAFEDMVDEFGVLDLVACVVTVTHAMQHGYDVPMHDRALARQDLAKLQNFVGFANKILRGTE